MLAKHPEKFKVTLVEKERVVGGQATSITLDTKQYGASWMNNGVQGGSSVCEERDVKPLLRSRFV